MQELIVGYIIFRLIEWLAVDAYKKYKK